MQLHRTIAAALAAALVATPAALAGEPHEIERSGTCSAGSEWDLDVEREHGGIRVEFEVDQDRTGVRWDITLRQNGRVVFRAQRTTQPPSGSFELRQLLDDRPGRDRIVAVATRSSGERCRASVRL
ncbi:MAG: hypothetical protein IT201_08465 [Thermoleophilia bacterium]|nr:hypothetical protein [Thermoleophilia bacterium]